MAGRELANLTEDRQRRRDRVEGEKRFQRVGIDLAARQSAKLGGESELVIDCAVVEGLDPEAIAGEHEPAPSPVPERDREHASQPLGEGVAVLLVQMQQHLGVALGAKAMPP